MEILKSSLDTEELFLFSAYGISLEQFNAYVEECKNMGYTVDPSSYEGFYSADDTEGYNVYLSYEEDDGDTGANTDRKSADGIRPEFKEAMDSYEAFYDEYCDFMKKYNANPSDRTLLDGYMDMLDRSVEMTEKFEAWDEGEMNDEELKYYLDVNNRVSQKMIDAME